MSRKIWNSLRNLSSETGEIPVFIGRIGTPASGILLRLNTNGLRLCDIDQIPPIGILKRMTADVTNSEWNHRTQVVFGTEARAE